MPENTTSTPLLDALRSLLLAHRSAFRQERTFLRAQALILAHLFCFARRTVTQALVALGLTDHDWSAFYRLFAEGRFDYERLSCRFFLETLPHVAPAEPYVAVVDGVQIPRSSRTMPGTSWLKSPKTPPFSPGPHRAQRFLNLACLLPKSGEEGYCRALPLRLEPAFPQKAVPAEGFPPKKQWEAALESTLWLRENLDAAGREGQRLLVVGDGDFSVAKMRASLPDPGGVVLVSRCAKNRALYGLPEPPEEGRRGRRRKYGQRARKPFEWLGEKKGWSQKPFSVRARTIRARHRVEGPFVLKGAPERPVFLLVVSGRKASKKGQKERKPAYWLVSAVRWEGDAHDGGEEWVLPYPAEELLFWAWQRWEVEVCHREMKSGFGLGEAQCWGSRSAIMSVRFRAWSYGVMVLAGVRAWGLGRGPIRPPGRWWGGSGRWSMGTLWRGYRSEMWGSEEFRPVLAATGGGWPKKEALLAARNNSVAGSLRG